MLTRVAITGPDDAVNVADLNALAKEFPYVEWALLYEPDHFGTPRTPSPEWIEDFVRNRRGGHAAMHLCNTALVDFSHGRGDVRRVIEDFDRIQLNFKYRDAGDRIDLAGLMRQVKSLPDITFILQYGGKYTGLAESFKDLPNVAVLFDGSAGTGVLPGSWPAPLPGFASGYAGGLGPDNIVAQVEKIKSVLPPGYKTWVDMESGVRTDDVFDLDKVRRVLTAMAPYIEKENVHEQRNRLQKGL